MNQEESQQIQTQYSRDDSAENFMSALSSLDSSVKSMKVAEDIKILDKETVSKHSELMTVGSKDDTKSKRMYPKLESEITKLKRSEPYPMHRLPKAASHSIQPLTLEQLKSLYYNPRLIQIDAIVDQFIQVTMEYFLCQF